MAQVLVRYSLATQPGHSVLIEAQRAGTPLAEEVCREVLRTGGHPRVRLIPANLSEIMVRDASDDQLRHVSDVELYEIDRTDAWLVISADENTKSLHGMPLGRLAMLRSARAPIMARCVERLARGEMRWCRTLFPTNATAQDAGMSLSSYEDFYFQASLVDGERPIAAWQELHDRQQRIVDFLNQRRDIRIVASGVDLAYNVAGRTWINGSGMYNFPDGEVFSGPVENSVNGTIRFRYPAVYNGIRVDDVALRFEDGKVVDADASSNKAFLLSMLDTDEGARYVGEVAFGLNPAVNRFTGNTLLDEKLGGTMHIAVGKSYPHTGGRNVSAIHWDMVADLSEGRVYADGALCYEDGAFLPEAIDDRGDPPADGVAALGLQAS